jgi:hypothetical protein
VLVLAKEFGQPPEAVEKWDAYWFNRAVEYLAGESLGEKAKWKKK